MYKLHDLDTHHLPAPFCKTQAHAVKQQTADGPWLLECQTSTANALPTLGRLEIFHGYLGRGGPMKNGYSILPESNILKMGG